MPSLIHSAAKQNLIEEALANALPSIYFRCSAILFFITAYCINNKKPFKQCHI